MKPGTRKFGAATAKVGRTVQLPVAMRDHILEVSSVHVPEDQRRMGHASALMHSICVEADQAGKLLLVHCKGYDSPGMTDRELEDWYGKFGFQVIQAEPRLMARMVGAAPRMFLTPISQAIK